MVDTNYWAILVSAIASMVIGSIWYGPLFGKVFMRASGMDAWTPEKQAEMKKKMIPMYLMQFVASFIMFFVFSRYFASSGQIGIMGGINNAFWIWLGFVVPLKLGDTIWGGNKTMFWLTIGNMLVTLLATGIIVGSY